jgi:tartrate-resistant acid phosphatase type 5
MGVFKVFEYLIIELESGKMKKNILKSIIAGLVFILPACSDQNETKTDKPILVVTSGTFKKALNFIIVSDWGWNGCYHQQEVADQMAKTSDSVNAKFIVSCGDNFQINGVASVQDPLWISSFENVYKEPSLLVDWYPVLGNHDYHGSPQAEIDYSKISRRWRLTDHYYSIVKKVNDSVSARLIFLDTSPLVDAYHKNSNQYPEIVKQDTAKEIRWLKDVLSNAKEQWILVFGHHPVFSASKTHGNTKEMIERIEPLLEKYHAQFYFCGHDHDLQHLHKPGQSVDYIVTGAGGEPRPFSSDSLTVFSGSEPSFSVVSLKGDSIRICFVGLKGRQIYNFSRSY